jgi:hypothetical protein
VHVVHRRHLRPPAATIARAEQLGVERVEVGRPHLLECNIRHVLCGRRSNLRRTVEETPRTGPAGVCSCWLVVLYQGKRDFDVRLVVSRDDRFCAVRYDGVTTSRPNVTLTLRDKSLEPAERYGRFEPRRIAGDRRDTDWRGVVIIGRPVV